MKETDGFEVTKLLEAHLDAAMSKPTTKREREQERDSNAEEPRKRQRNDTNSDQALNPGQVMESSSKKHNSTERVQLQAKLDALQAEIETAKKNSRTTLTEKIDAMGVSSKGIGAVANSPTDTLRPATSNGKLKRSIGQRLWAICEEASDETLQKLVRDNPRIHQAFQVVHGLPLAALQTTRPVRTRAGLSSQAFGDRLKAIGEGKPVDNNRGTTNTAESLSSNIEFEKSSESEEEDG